MKICYQPERYYTMLIYFLREGRIALNIQQLFVALFLGAYSGWKVLREGFIGRINWLKILIMWL